MKAVSLFCSGGIGDLGLHANNIRTIIHNELITNRYELFCSNYPESRGFNSDIWEAKDDIITSYRDNHHGSPFLILATPPCQGMSPNGAGKLLSDYRKGLRPKLDPRNRLIIPTLDIIEALQPDWVILENVPNMLNTVIQNEENELVNIMDYVHDRLPNYVGKGEIVNIADYGVPQIRKRLITILTKTEQGKEFYKSHDTFLPPQTHSKNGGNGTKKWITLRQAIGHFPSLDAKKGFEKALDFHPLHYVPVEAPDKYYWISHTKEDDTAFNNQCVNPECLYSNNTRHGATKDTDGINKFNKTTPVYCENCGQLLPRPWVKDKNTGEYRIMKGFTSAYKRMSWDEPARTLTQNFQYSCSDNKLHPEQNRVLSLYEGLVLQSIADYNYSFKINGTHVTKSVIRDVIGESVAPKLIDVITSYILKISREDIELLSPEVPRQTHLAI